MSGYFDDEEATDLTLPVLGLSGFIPGRYQ
jgi:hypothetical protein